MSKVFFIYKNFSRCFLWVIRNAENQTCRKKEQSEPNVIYFDLDFERATSLYIFKALIVKSKCMCRSWNTIQKQAMHNFDRLIGTLYVVYNDYNQFDSYRVFCIFPQKQNFCKMLRFAFVYKYLTVSIFNMLQLSKFLFQESRKSLVFKIVHAKYYLYIYKKASNY